MRRRERTRQDSLQREGEGSNAWAFAPSRSKSGHAILLRNPHLEWTAVLLDPHGDCDRARLSILEWHPDGRSTCLREQWLTASS